MNICIFSCFSSFSFGGYFPPSHFDFVFSSSLVITRFLPFVLGKRKIKKIPKIITGGSSVDDRQPRAFAPGMENRSSFLRRLPPFAVQGWSIDRIAVKEKEEKGEKEMEKVTIEMGKEQKQEQE